MAGDTVRRTPLNDAHREAGARMVPFAGWDMPVQYQGILEETRAVRERCGIFDIGHMARVDATGPEGVEFVQRLTTNDVSALGAGQAHYSLLTNPSGGVVDDLIVYRTGDASLLLVLNAGNADKDLAWLRSQMGPAAPLTDNTARTCMVAVQGPQAVAMVGHLAGMATDQVTRFGHTSASVAGVPVRLCRTGYTGEDGFEVIGPADGARQLWDAFVDAGAQPCGLGARDVLRTEAGYPLYGHEIDDTTTPVEAGLMWVVKLEKGDFVGRDAIVAAKRKGAERKLMGMLMADRVTPRQGYTLQAGADIVGTVTSGVFSPVRSVGLGMAYVQTPHAVPGAVLQLAVRQALHPAKIVPKKDLLGR